GTSGEYSFESETQMFKVPHLRNAYQKVGKFGQPPTSAGTPESILGPLRGGFFAQEHRYEGEQVRGFGFLHDGSTDTLHLFHGARVFPADGNSPNGIDAIFPVPETRAACVSEFRAAKPERLSIVPAALAPLAPLCLAASTIPDACFLDPSAAGCDSALAAL